MNIREQMDRDNAAWEHERVQVNYGVNMLHTRFGPMIAVSLLSQLTAVCLLGLILWRIW